MENILERIEDFLDQAPFYGMATVEEGQARVRPFDSILLYEEQLYILSHDQKNIYQQIASQPQIELAAAHEDGQWMRLRGKLSVCYEPGPIVTMLDKRPDLQDLYAVDDGKTMTYVLESGSVIFYSPEDEGQSFNF